MSNAYAPDAPEEDETAAPAAADKTEGERQKTLVLDDEEFLRIVTTERTNSIGMADAPHGGDTVISERERAFQYYKGQMDDVPFLPNRSGVTTSEVRDAILTIVPDIVEIFLSGDEIGVFEPVGPEDEEAAAQETAIVNHVIFGRNEAFLMIYDAVHDALLAKYGVVHFYAETNERDETEHFEAAHPIEMAMAQESGEISDVREVAPINQEALAGGDLEAALQDAAFSFTLTRHKRDVQICTESVAPEDFGMSRDDGRTYRLMRSRQRRQDLIEQGYDAEQVMQMPTDTDAAAQQIDQARDLAGEHDASATAGAAIPELQQVIVHVHNIRVDADGDGRTEVWRVVSDENESILLEKKEIPCWEFAGGSPVRQPHRPYGFSVADLLMDVQKIKTALTRMLLDQGYFAINQRHEINIERATESTVTDYLNNVPGRPVLSRGQAIQPISPGAPGFNPFEALEYFATLGELRAGVMRASMGIDPDSLHETKGAALAMLSAAQRRVRFLARTLAETMFRDLFLGVHTLLRNYGGNSLRRRIRGKWVATDPSKWGARDNMTCDIGSGLAGREYDLAVANNIRGMMSEIVTGQAEGAIKAEIVTPQNIYNLARRIVDRAGWKSADLYLTDPSKQPQKQQGDEQQQPDPELIKIQQQGQLDQAKAQQKAKLDAFIAQENARIKEQSARADIDVKRAELQNEMQLARERAVLEASVARERADTEAQLAIYKANLEAGVETHRTRVMSDVELRKNRPGGRLDE